MNGNIKVIGEHDANTIAQLEMCASMGAHRAVLCADGHLGYNHPIGGAIAYKDRISISGVGFDIACGNMAVKLPVKASEINVDDRLRQIGRAINKRISFGIGRTNVERVEAAVLDTEEYWKSELLAPLKDLAASQLGTVGSGNHYVDVFRDEEDYVWIGVHFGSRGLGHKATTHFLKAIDAKQGMMDEPAIVDLNTDIGQQYLAAMKLGGEYAYAGRQWVCEEVSRIIQGNTNWIDMVHNHHNFAFMEEHFGESLFVVRKGSTPAFPGQRSFVGGSMGDISVILRGLDTEAARENMYSTVHGAGRVMSRTVAAGKFKGWGKNRKQVAPGLIDRDAMRLEVAAQGVHLFGGGADEAPQVYRKLDNVLKYHLDSVEIEHRLTPMIVVMARPEEFDPYKD